MTKKVNKEDKDIDFVIDILQMEIDQNLPYWLSAEAKSEGKRDEIRKKFRKKWLARQKKKQ